MIQWHNKLVTSQVLAQISLVMEVMKMQYKETKETLNQLVADLSQLAGSTPNTLVHARN